jgi:hypothetical protein
MGATGLAEIGQDLGKVWQRERANGEEPRGRSAVDLGRPSRTFNHCRVDVGPREFSVGSAMW